MVRDALLWLEEADPCETMVGIAEADPERAELAAVLDTIRETLDQEAFTTAELIEKTKQPSDIAHLLDTTIGGSERGPRPQLKEALLAVAADFRKTTDISAKRLGRYFEKHQGEIVGGRRLVRVGEARSGVALWRIEGCDGATAKA